MDLHTQQTTTACTKSSMSSLGTVWQWLLSFMFSSFRPRWLASISQLTLQPSLKGYISRPYGSRTAIPNRRLKTVLLCPWPPSQGPGPPACRPTAAELQTVPLDGLKIEHNTTPLTQLSQSQSPDSDSFIKPWHRPHGKHHSHQFLYCCICMHCLVIALVLLRVCTAVTLQLMCLQNRSLTTAVLFLQHTTIWLLASQSEPL
jgi:hypothetical protein